MASEATNVSPNATQPSGLAQRYALALLELAKDKKAVDSVAADLDSLNGLWSKDAAFRAFVEDPRLDSGAQRRGALAVLERAGISGEVRNLVGVMIANRRLAALPQVIAAFGTLLAEQRGQQTAEVATAHPLSDTQRTQLVARLTEAGYSNVKLVERVDTTLLGGLVVRLGSRLYDSSIKSKLQRLQYAMKGAA
ncbi:F0F1 ATP synthase subunit delta [Teichococcus aestuarii]|uniref:ATP synthase subunit delta n=1 Tax=Teichococcus aestuarii TaxID=568898 RepID=A0A2U1V743_9PROT|nr:F0F1 ATP synthase subunit delta [Pseudoroseomonas aestuarii]PWC29720.1 F0F1 ATP synthase subunit delta [Pseudoroseomonas aestuarii]